MLTWATGTFELEPPDEKSVLEEIQESTEALLMEGMRQLDEVRPHRARAAAAPARSWRWRSRCRRR